MTRYLLLVLLLFHIPAFGQSLSADGDNYNWEANILTGLNTDGWEISFGAAYFPVEYIGIKANIGLATEIEGLVDFIEGITSDYIDFDEPYYYDTARFKFNPSLVFRTPRLIHLKSQDAGFYMFAEPGFVLSPGGSGSRNAKACCWDLKCGINFQIDRLILFAGYGISNFYLFSGYRPDNFNSGYLTHFGFIGSAFKF